MMITRTTNRAISGSLALALLAASALPAGADAGVDTVDAAVKLLPYVEQVRHLPGPEGHDFKYSTSTFNWSVVGIKPIGRTDADLWLYDDKDHNDLLVTSSQTVGRTDFIAVDSNHRSFGGYFPEVRKEAGAGSYRIELAHGATNLGEGDETVTVSASDVVLVRDTLLMAGQEYVFGVGGVPGAVLYLVGSDPDSPWTWVQPRSAAIDSTPTSGFQIFSYTAARTDWYGVVVTLPGTEGQVTMIRETVE